MSNKFKLIEYTLSGYSTLDNQTGFGHEICTDKQYAYILEVEEHYCSYIPHPRPGDYWQHRVVSAASHAAEAIKILTIGDSFQCESDTYIFCHSFRYQRIGVIRSGQDILINLPRHPYGGHTWGYSGGGPSNTCDVIWGDIIGKQNLDYKYPDVLDSLFGRNGVLPQAGNFAITADVIKQLATKSK